MLALVVQRVQLVLVVIDAALTIEQQGVRLETVPEAENDIDEFLAALIADRMRIEPLAIEIIAGFVVVGGDDVPAGPATA
ncbi:hypothetical protein D3C87_1795040 [compost metagenome]